MRRYPNGDLAPLNDEVGVVICLFGEDRDLIDEGDACQIRGKVKGSDKFVPLDCPSRQGSQGGGDGGGREEFTAHLGVIGGPMEAFKYRNCIRAGLALDTSPPPPKT